jgi:hypothetical protein
MMKAVAAQAQLLWEGSTGFRRCRLGLQARSRLVHHERREGRLVIRRQHELPPARGPPPCRHLLRRHTVPTRDIHHPGASLKALGHDARLHRLGPAPPARGACHHLQPLDNLAPAGQQKLRAFLQRCGPSNANQEASGSTHQHPRQSGGQDAAYISRCAVAFVPPSGRRTAAGQVRPASRAGEGHRRRRRARRRAVLIPRFSAGRGDQAAERLAVRSVATTVSDCRRSSRSRAACQNQCSSGSGARCACRRISAQSAAIRRWSSGVHGDPVFIHSSSAARRRRTALPSGNRARAARP